MKNLKILDNNLEEVPVTEEVQELIDYQRFQIIRREEKMRKKREQELRDNPKLEEDETNKYVSQKTFVQEEVKDIKDNSKFLFGNDGQIHDLSANMVLRKDVNKAKYAQFPEMTEQLEFYADQRGSAVSTVHVHPSQLKVVKKKGSKFSICSSDESEKGSRPYTPTSPNPKLLIRQNCVTIDPNQFKKIDPFSGDNILDWMKHDPVCSPHSKLKKKDEKELEKEITDRGSTERINQVIQVQPGNVRTTLSYHLNGFAPQNYTGTVPYSPNMSKQQYSKLRGR